MTHDESVEFHNADGTFHSLDQSENPKWYPDQTTKMLTQLSTWFADGSSSRAPDSRLSPRTAQGRYLPVGTLRPPWGGRRPLPVSERANI